MPETRIETYCEKVGHDVQIKLWVNLTKTLAGYFLDHFPGKCRYQEKCGIGADNCDIIKKATEHEVNRLKAEYEEEQRRAKEEQEKWGF